MIVNLKDKTELETLVTSIKADAIKQNLNLNDSILCLENIFKSMVLKHPTDLRFDTPTGLDVKKGIITNASVDYVPMSTLDCKITIELQENPDAQPVSYSFDFLLQNMEVNTMSSTNSHFKFYINDANKKVLVGVIIYFNR